MGMLYRYEDEKLMKGGSERELSGLVKMQNLNQTEGTSDEEKRGWDMGYPCEHTRIEAPMSPDALRSPSAEIY